jgi:propanol-preferring alcohol dehydrogenase
MMNDWGLGPMSQHGTICAGHEGAGVIVKAGDQVKNLKVGQRAGLKPVADTCGVCDLCRTDKECYCAKAVLTGFHCDGMTPLP